MVFQIRTPFFFRKRSDRQPDDKYVMFFVMLKLLRHGILVCEVKSMRWNVLYNLIDRRTRPIMLSSLKLKSPVGRILFSGYVLVATAMKSTAVKATNASRDRSSLARILSPNMWHIDSPSLMPFSRRMDVFPSGAIGTSSLAPGNSIFNQTSKHLYFPSIKSADSRWKL